jgi:endonuclease/exonuclease/phosphatase family metal-dependent hydrolase
MEKLRVVTLNLWGQSGAWADRRSVLSAALRALRPDLVAFQEALKSGEYDQVLDLLGGDFHVAHQTHRGADGSGISIANRWPLTDVQEVDLHVMPRTADFACSTLIAEIQVPDPFGSVLFVNHLPSWQLNFELERELQSVAAARVIEQRIEQRCLHVVLVGDFDADPDAASVRFWFGRQSLGGISVCYRDTWESTHPGEPGDTFTPRNPLVIDWDWPFRRIDYIFVRCGKHGGPTLRIAACSRICDEPIDGVWASNHFGLVADLAVPAQRLTSEMDEVAEWEHMSL